MRISDWSSDVCSSDLLPRVYDIALNAISHGDGRVDVESLGRFIAAYQSATPLTLGELWAIPIMLRLALIENLRRVSAQVIAGRIDRDLADLWGDRFTEMAESDPKSVVLVIRSEEHTSELQSLMRISYAVFCLKKKN